MRTYRDKEDLKNEIRQSFEKYNSEFDTVPEALKDKRVPEVDRTPAEDLAYQLGWTTLLLKWEADEKRGMDVKTPSEQFNGTNWAACTNGSRTPMPICPWRN